MIETYLSGIALVTTVAVGGSIWYKLGKLEQKVNFIYKNINVAVKWSNDSRNKD